MATFNPIFSAYCSISLEREQEFCQTLLSKKRIFSHWYVLQTILWREYALMENFVNQKLQGEYKKSIWYYKSKNLEKRSQKLIRILRSIQGFLNFWPRSLTPWAHKYDFTLHLALQPRGEPSGWSAFLGIFRPPDKKNMRGFENLEKLEGSSVQKKVLKATNVPFGGINSE